MNASSILELQYCRVEHRGRITVITICRQEVRNALHRPACLELEEVFDRFADEPLVDDCADHELISG